jgi:adenylosuccinate lyase
VVYPNVIARNVAEELPFMATENLMMAAVKNGRDRQEVHERIRTHAIAAGARIKGEGASNDLMDRLRDDPSFAGIDVDEVIEPSRFVGRSPEQVIAFVGDVVDPIRRRYPLSGQAPPEIHV